MATDWVYRGVEYDGAATRETPRPHGEDLVYRGVRFEGAQAEQEAAPRPTRTKHVYRGVISAGDRF